MVVPVFGTIPDSTLSPGQVRQKFSGLRGLGDDCSSAGGTCTSYDELGDCFTCDYSSAPSTTTFTLPGQGITPPFFSSIGVTPPTSGASATGSYMSQGGNIITTYSDGTFTMVSPDTGAVSSGHGTPPPAASGSTSYKVTAPQANAWASMITALAGAGVKLGTVAMLQPGQTLLANGTIVGSGQSLMGSTVNSTFGAILSNPMLLIGGFGLLAVLVLAGGRR